MMRSTEPAIANRVTANENQSTTWRKTLVTSLGLCRRIHMVMGKCTVNGHCEEAVMHCVCVWCTFQQNTYKADGPPVVHQRV